MKKTISILLCVAMLMMMFTACGNNKTTVELKSQDDLHGLTIGCQSGTTGELIIQEDYTDAKLKSYKSGMDAALDLKNGRLDAVILDELPAKSIIAQNDDLMIVDLGFEAEEYSIAVQKGNTELLDAINKVIKDLKDNGTYDDLKENFMPADGNIIIPDDIQTDGDVIKMGTNAAFKPFEYVEGDKIVGFDITISQYVAKALGKKLEVVNMEFDSLIAALQAGTVDFVAAGMTVTEDRLKNVDFSDSYFSSKQVMIVRK